MYMHVMDVIFGASEASPYSKSGVARLNGLGGAYVCVSRSVPVLFARPSFSVPTPAYTMSAADDAEPPVPEAQRRRLADTAEQAERRRTQARERQRAFRLAETEAQDQRRRTKIKQRQSASRLAATEAQAQQCLLLLSMHTHRPLQHSSYNLLLLAHNAMHSTSITCTV